MKNTEFIMKATKYSDIFSEKEVDAKREYREYCKIYHPDVNDSKEAAKAFAVITELYTNKHRSIKVNSTIDEDITFKNKVDGKGFVLSNPVVFKTGISMIYHTSTKVAIVYHKSYEKFFNNYLNQVNTLKYEDSNMEKEFKRYFPKILKHFETEDDTLCILLDKTEDVLNLGKILASYIKQGEKFPEKQAAWIINRLYNIECYLYFNKKVFNGFSTDNIWVSPEMHSVLMFGGWEYTTRTSEQMLGCPKDVYNILPIKVKDSKKSDLITDLESIKSIGRILYKGQDNLEHINKFLYSGIKYDNPFDEWEAYKVAIKQEFGKREFIVWDNVPYN